MAMLQLTFILDLNFVFLRFGLSLLCMIMSLKLESKKFKPRIKLNHKRYKIQGKTGDGTESNQKHGKHTTTHHY